MIKALGASAFLVIFALPGNAQSVDAHSSKIRSDRIAFEVHDAFRNDPSFVRGSVRPGLLATPRLQEFLSDSSKHPAARDIVLGAGIGGALGVLGGMIASRRKQSVEVDLGENWYMILGLVSGAVLGAIGGAVFHAAED
jgi:hypothetical protein